jgi:hypothetical protein
MYAHVTEEADQRAVAEWVSFTTGWRPAGREQIGGCS